MKAIAMLLGGLLLLVLLAGLFLFLAVFRPKKLPDLTHPESLRGGHWEDRIPHMQKDLQWLSTRSVDTLQTTSRDGKRLTAYLVKQEQARGTVLLFHGYHSSWLVDFAAAMQFYYEEGYQLLLCDQRCHGASEGTFITFGVREHEDLTTWVDTLAQTLGKDHPIYLCGLSMGAASVLMAADAAFSGNVRGIIADCGYTSPREILRWQAKAHYHLPGRFSAALLNLYAHVLGGFGLSEASALDALGRTTLPVLLFHGQADRVVPCAMAEQLQKACRTKARLVEIPGAGHGACSLVDGPRYQAAAAAFLRENLREREI